MEQWEIYFVIKPLISEMSVKGSVSCGAARFFFFLSSRVLEKRDLSARCPGGLDREGGARGSWGQWVPQSCSLDGPQMGAVRTTHRGHQQDGAKSRLGREAGVQRAREAPTVTPLTPAQTQAPSEVVQRQNAGIRFQGLTKPLAVGTRWPSARRGRPVASS